MWLALVIATTNTLVKENLIVTFQAIFFDELVAILPKFQNLGLGRKNHLSKKLF
jgi:hypothetical protein